jgi:hypothetical protein
VAELYSTTPIPPIAKQKIRLSMSKPVLLARLKRLGGDQYSGTNKGSVNPNGIVAKLASSITRRYAENRQYKNTHGSRNALAHRNQTYW